MIDSLTALYYAVGSTVIISLVSLAGVFTLSMRAETIKKYLLYTVSFATGALLGGAFLHLLPHLIEAEGRLSINGSLLILFGFISMFVFEKLTGWYHSHDLDHATHSHKKDHSPIAVLNTVGDAVHNFIDGLIIGTVYLVSIPAGIAITISTFLHEIPMELADFGLLLHSGLKRKTALFVNLVTGLTSVLGAIVAIVFASKVPALITILLAIGIGNFIYIASAVLIPELLKEEDWNKSLLHLLLIVLGIALMMLLLLVE